MLWDLAIKSLLRRKLRSILTLLGVMIAVQLYLLMSGVLIYYRDDMQQQLSVFTGKIFVQQKLEGRMGSIDFSGSGSSLTNEAAADLLSLDGINQASSSPVLFVPVARSSVPYSPPAVLIVGLLPGHESTLLSGSDAQTGTLALSGSDSVILGVSAARHYQTDGSDNPVRAGQSIQIEGQAFQVVGVIKQGPQLLNGAVIMPLASAQALFDRGSSVSAVILTAARLEDAGSIKSGVEARYPDLYASTQDDFTKNAETIMNGMQTFFGAINVTVLIVAGVLITIVMVVAVMEQRREIGTLRAIGARRWRIFSMVGAESLALSLVGALLAFPIALLLVEFGWKLNGSMVVRDILSIWPQSVGSAVLVGVLASILPAWQAVRVDPLESLRYE